MDDSVGSVETVQLDQFEKDFFHQLNSLRLSNLLCDVRFNVNGIIMPCHRVVLATASPYFRTMFNGNFKESNCDTITMNDIETEAFEEIVNAMYTASIRFSASNAFFILKASHLLQLEMIENACASYIIKNCKINFVVETCVFAKNIRRIELFHACKTTIKEEIIEYGKTDSLKKIPIDIIEILLREYDNTDINEELMLVFIIKWSKENKADREVIQRLLNLAELKVTKYVSPSFMTELLVTCDDKRIDDRNTETSEQSDQIGSNLPLKLYLNTINVQTGQQGWCILEMNDEMKKYAVSSFYLTNSRYKKVCKFGSKLYCFEYFKYQEEKNIFSYYDEDNNRTFLPSPEDTISEFEMFAMDTSIYVMSKQDQQFSVWLYDIEQNTWRNILENDAHETIYCNVSACTFSNGVFYIVAEKYTHAFNEDSKLPSLRSKYIYSITVPHHSLDVTRLKRISKMPIWRNSVCEYPFIYVFDRKIVVPGTSFDGGIHDQFMIYDSEAKHWLKSSRSMKGHRVNLNLFHFNGFIYAVENGRVNVPNEKYDLRLNKWIDLPPLPKQLTHASTNAIVATGEVFGIEVNL